MGLIVPITLRYWDPAVLNADSDPVTEWIRATTEGVGGMTAEEWEEWIDVVALAAA